jgi:hypothetical protein
MCSKGKIPISNCSKTLWTKMISIESSCNRISWDGHSNRTGDIKTEKLKIWPSIAKSSWKTLMVTGSYHGPLSQNFRNQLWEDVAEIKKSILRICMRVRVNLSLNLILIHHHHHLPVNQVNPVNLHHKSQYQNNLQNLKHQNNQHNKNKYNSQIKDN